MSVGGLSEEWAGLDDETKSKIREVIAGIERLQPSCSSGGT